MTAMVDPQRLRAASATVQADLWAESEPAGYWTGELSSSALATATAISALALYEPTLDEDDPQRNRVASLIRRGLHWLARQQNNDGGWGDTDRSNSNISTTMLARAAFQLTGVPAEFGTLIDQAEEYIAAQGGVRGLKRRYGRDKTFAVPILTNCALAGLVPWRVVSALPFELACLPQRLYKFLRLPVVSYAIPALVAVGLVRFHNRPPWNPLTRWWRRRSIDSSLEVLNQLQPASGGFLEAVPLTSFVVMSLLGAGQGSQAAVAHGVRFLFDSVRDDGSWPIDTNLATWVTTQSLNALDAAGEELNSEENECLDWLLECQHTEPHPYTGAAPGGWAWTDLSGGVPDVDDTASALLALAAYAKLPTSSAPPSPGVETKGSATRTRGMQPPGLEAGETVLQSATAGVEWLLEIQNSDGGWPTFCRGWGKLPFDRSGTDLTAHAIRALDRWSKTLNQDSDRAERIRHAIQRGFKYLSRTQHEDGSWVPLWFGNQHAENEENRIYGTSRVLLAYRDLNRLDSEAARRGYAWLLSAQDLGGGWGGGGRQIKLGAAAGHSSVEETALAIYTLLSDPRLDSDEYVQHMLGKGLAWLVEAVDRGQHLKSSPIGYYFARLWYYERLYPILFATSALGAAVKKFAPHETAVVEAPGVEVKGAEVTEPVAAM